MPSHSLYANRGRPVADGRPSSVGHRRRDHHEHLRSNHDRLHGTGRLRADVWGDDACCVYRLPRYRPHPR